MQDANQLVEDMNIDATKTAAEKAAVMTAQASNLIELIAQAPKKIGEATKGIEKAFESVQNALNMVKNSKLMKLMGPVMAVATAAIFAWSAYGAYRDWSNLSIDDRAILILSTVQTTLQRLEDGAKAFSPLFKSLRRTGPEVSIAPRDTIAGSIEENTELRLPENSEKGQVEIELIDHADELPGGVADQEAEAQQVADDVSNVAELGAEDAAEVAIGADVEAAATKLGALFAIGGKIIKGLLGCVGVALTIFSALSLA
ncbi:uncharacterized protein MYCFIDRAFT_212464 [Pseudocercospora fijiensis CIRAD86]|uniref:Uncharacterized protein n=1 Tax=Pseudocercospora fijiensis (strain CIRAD86) TaxID=383855 RepID=M3AMR3_PSEFD|nr:uncharacterized protein MYCFIDRAFT_212464 [Pseudocercospora fijiensis CIRAD86]EME78732.1 hypothetical protein MYCFIDRAFT_212464 [Pseudocercospora fijiensis CIRAD86]